MKNLLSLLLLSSYVSAGALPAKRAATVEIDGHSFVNKGLVAFGRIPSNSVESTGDTLGGLSAISLKPNTYRKLGNRYSGTLVVHPDRGYNVESTIDYQSRRLELDFILLPYTGSTPLSLAEAEKTLQVTYKSTFLQKEATGRKTTGLDALSIRPASSSFPQLPISSKADNKISIDGEGLVANIDGSVWVSDEYGPYIYKFSRTGDLVTVIQPPSAILPRDVDGKLNFTSSEEPLVTVTGRSPNKGFEGLTLDKSTGTLYAMLQTATIQDGGSDKKTARYTRMVGYNIRSDPPELVGEWVIPLPLSDKDKARGCSEIQFLGDGIFLALSRDGDGRGSDDFTSEYKQADLFSIKNATDIHGTKYDNPANPVSPGGVLVDEIQPAEYKSFVNYLDPADLRKFALHNGEPDDETLIDAKWESLTLTPVMDSQYPNDYFLFSAADNDYQTTSGMMLGEPYDAGVDVDTQFLVWRVELPVVEG